MKLTVRQQLTPLSRSLIYKAHESKAIRHTRKTVGKSMTLVAAFSIRDIPCMVGDIVISSTATNQEQQSSLPTIGALGDTFHDGPIKITDTQQKLHIISKRLVVGWSDSQLVASVHINELIKIDSENEKPLEHILEYFANLDHQSEIYGAGIIGWLVQEGDFHLFSHNINESHTYTKFNEMKADGSGAPRFVEYLRTLENDVVSAPDNLSNENLATIDLKTTIGKFLMEENDTSESLSNYYGAGYEVVVYSNHEFKKIGETVFFLNDLTLGQHGHECKLKLYMAYDYVGDVLRIQSLLEQDGTAYGRQYLVRPANRYKNSYSQYDLQSIASTPFDWNRKYLYLQSNVRTYLSNIKTVFRLSCVTDQDVRPVWFNMDDSGFHYKHHPSIIRKIKEKTLGVVVDYFQTGKIKGKKGYTSNGEKS